MSKLAVSKVVRYKAPYDFGLAFAPVNIALCKYWENAMRFLHLPLTNSLSIC